MRRSRTSASLVVAVAVAFAAGTIGTGAWGARGPAWAATAATLTVAAAADGYYENPKLPSIGKYPTNANIFETLVRMTPDYRVVPDLATRWRFIAPNTWRFFLRR